MTMHMGQAFNSMMETECTSYIEKEGYYDKDNIWINGTTVASKFFAVNQAGNKFSQFDEGIARHAMEGGNRFSDYRNLYVKDIWPELAMNDKVEFKGEYYNILQKSDEGVFGFYSYIVEKDKLWKPNTAIKEV